MTEKDYELIANTLGRARVAAYNTSQRSIIDLTTRLLANELAADSMQFRRDVFLRTAGASDQS